MPDVVDTKVSPDFSVGELAMVGGLKAVSERLLANTPVGNGTLRSGGAKVLMGYGTFAASKGRSGTLPKAGRLESTALVVDGVEDVFNDLMGRFNFGFAMMQGQTGSGEGRTHI